MTESGHEPSITDVLLERYLAGDLGPEALARIEALLQHDEALRERVSALRESSNAYLNARPPEAFAHLLSARLAQEEPGASWWAGFGRGAWSSWVPVGVAAIALVLALGTQSFEELGERPLALESAAPTGSELMAQAREPAPAEEGVAMEEQMEQEVLLHAELVEEPAEAESVLAAKAGGNAPVPGPAALLDAKKSVALELLAVRQAPPKVPKQPRRAARTRKAVPGAASAGGQSRKAGKRKAVWALESLDGAGAPASVEESSPPPRPMMKVMAMSRSVGLRGPSCTRLGRKVGESWDWGDGAGAAADGALFLELRREQRQGHWLVVSVDEGRWRALWPKKGHSSSGATSMARLERPGSGPQVLRVFWALAPFSLADLPNPGSKETVGQQRIRDCGTHSVRF